MRSGDALLVASFIGHTPVKYDPRHRAGGASRPWFFCDAGSPDLRTGFDMAGARYRCEGGMVIRLRPSRPTVEALTSAAAAAFLII